MNWPHNDIVEEHEDWSNDVIDPFIECEEPLEWEQEEFDWNHKDVKNHSPEGKIRSIELIIVFS